LSQKPALLAPRPSRAPGFTITVVATLALAIATNAAVFSAVNAVLLEPLDFPNLERLARVMEIGDGGANESAISAPRLEDWNRERLSATP
jgi:hypothetical protein